jgi:hypothetical protein
MSEATTPQFTLEIEALGNGRLGVATVLAIGDDGKQLDSDRANLAKAAERKKLAQRMAEKLGHDPDDLLARIDSKWNEMSDEHRRLKQQAEAGSAEAVPIERIHLLDAPPREVRRPLCLVGGRAYAAAWVPIRRETFQAVKDGAAVKYAPPLVSVSDVLLVVTGEGMVYSDKDAPGARPLCELGLAVRLPTRLPPGRGWSGAGVKRFLAGQRPDPADVFSRLTLLVDRFIDFNRSVAPQTTLCELVACYILGTYLLDAFNVVGYLWPNGGTGSGKTTLLDVIAETAYLGQLILAGGSFASLRDMADYGATLCFDDAENVMDIRKVDPDKRALLLAGNRRGATVPVKELTAEKTWQTRFVDTFCPRCFSAIRLPDQVLGSRSTIVPLVRSADPERAKANPQDHATWPCGRQRLVDDLWAVGLCHLPLLPEYDRQAATLSGLLGRDLDRWRTVLAMSLWLQERHGVEGLFDRMKALSDDYQAERAEGGADAHVRVMVLALWQFAAGKESFEFETSQLAEAMNNLARAEGLTDEADDGDDGDGGGRFTNAKRVGWLLRQQRFRRPKGKSKGRIKRWAASAVEVEQLARAFNVRLNEPESA